MTSTRLVSTVMFAAAVAGCDAEQAPSGQDSPPAHPAMLAPASAKGGPGAGAGSAAGPGARAAMPAGHPPIGELLPDASGTPPPVAGGAAAGAGAAGAAGAPGASGAAAAGDLAAKLSQFGLALTLPQGWVEEASTSAMRLATIRLPRAEGDAEDGEISVMHAGGSVEANVERWSAQFTEKPKPVQSRKDVGGIQVTLVELEGTFTGGGGPMAKSGGPKPGTKLLGAIVRPPGDDQLLFIKAWGPKATLEKWKPSFEQMAGSLRPAR